MKNANPKVIQFGFLTGLEDQMNLRITVWLICIVLLLGLILTMIVALCALLNRRARREGNWVLEHPEYGAFLDEHPERQFEYCENLPEVFSMWLSKRQNAEQSPLPTGITENAHVQFVDGNNGSGKNIRSLRTL